jgi:hypothetical protein
MSSELSGPHLYHADVRFTLAASPESTLCRASNANPQPHLRSAAAKTAPGQQPPSPVARARPPSARGPGRSAIGRPKCPSVHIGFTESGRLFLGQRRLTPCESLTNGSGQGRPLQLERVGDQPQVVIVLQPAAGDSADGKGMELLGDHRLDRISPQVRCRRIEQRRIVDLDGTGSDRIAKAHINLDRDAGAGDRGLGACPLPLLPCGLGAVWLPISIA